MDLQTQPVAFLFPGQGSQFIGMGFDLANEYSIAKQIYAIADDLLNFPLSELCWKGPEEQLGDTANTQPALYVHSIAALKVFQEHFPKINPMYIAGHSLGEFSALTAANSISFIDGLKLVSKRGELMKWCGLINPGGMAAIIGLNISQLESICRHVNRSTNIVQVANDNCPGQIVISGSLVALDYAIELAKKKGARRIIRLNVSIAAHTPLMAPIYNDFLQVLKNSSIIDPVIPVISNITAMPLINRQQVINDLAAQLISCVRWTDSIKYMIDNGVQTFIEIGSGVTLSGLIKRINKKAQCYAFGKPDDLKALKYN